MQEMADFDRRIMASAKITEQVMCLNVFEFSQAKL